jgi:hypothetical protein
LSETLTATVNFYETESQAYEPGDYSAEANHLSEIKDPTWGDNLLDLVSANAHVRVKCSWMGGDAVTLSEAMTTYSYPPNMTAADEPLIISVVQELLANRVEETALGQEEEKAEEESMPEELSHANEEEMPGAEEGDKSEGADQKNETEPEDEGAQVTQNIDKVERQPKNENDTTKKLEIYTSRPERPPEPEKRNVAAKAVEPKTIPGPAKTKPNQPTQTAAKAETTLNSLSSFADSKRGVRASTSEVAATANIKPEARATKSTTGRAHQQPKTVQPRVERPLAKSTAITKPNIGSARHSSGVEAPETDAAIIAAVEISTPTEIPEFIEDQKIEPLTLPEAIEAVTPEFEPEESHFSDIEEIAFPDYIEGLTEYNFEASEEGMPPVALENQVGAISLYGLIGTQLLAPEGGEGSGGEGEQMLFPREDSESKPVRQMEPEIPRAEQLAPISLPIEEIENTLEQLAERIEEDEPERVEIVNKALGEIVEVTVRFESQSGENIITGAEIQEKLEELFTELLDTMGIEYTPELIESLVYLTLKRHLIDEVKKPKNEEQEEVAPQVTGTNEAIKQFLLGLSIAAKSMTHAYAIGKSALRLSFNSAANLRI